MWSTSFAQLSEAHAFRSILDVWVGSLSRLEIQH
jgi:hypothetical protein